MTDPSVLRGRTCLLTGATGGIGTALAHVLAAHGIHLLLSGRNTDRLTVLAREIGDGTSVKISTVVADLADDAGIASVIAAGEDLGGIDILINNAGLFPRGALFDLSESEFDRCIAANLRAPYRLCRAFAQDMVQRRWGRIVNVASSSAYAGYANSSAYCASKHGLLGLSRALDVELRGGGVRVYCVSPGSVKTAMGRELVDQDYDTFIEPGEVAEYVLFLLALNGNMISQEARLNRMTYR